MKSDIEIARETPLKPIEEIAAGLGIDREEIEAYGRYIAKVPYDLKAGENRKEGKLILVTAITTTKAGIGKTTVSVGLALGMARRGYKAVLALREPSLGPCFGMKGGAAGGGYAQVLPMDRINLHFTGDFRQQYDFRPPGQLHLPAQGGRLQDEGDTLAQGPGCQ